MTLQGYTLPQSPTGASALVPPPPWHFSGDVILVEYGIDPDAAGRFLPEGVSPAPEARAAAIFGSWQSCTDDGEELLEPVRSQYMEFYIALLCRIGERTVVRCPFCWVDRDFSLVRGLIQGYPKKLGSIWMTRPGGIGRAAPRLAPGGRFGASLAAADRRLAQLTLTLTEPADTAPELMTAPMVHTRLMPAWAPGGAAIEELVTGGSRDQEVADVWRGDATLELFEAPHEDLHLLRPERVLGGFRLAFAETLDGGTLALGA